jgi:hypothetical protein
LTLEQRHDGPSKLREVLNQRHDIISQKTLNLRNNFKSCRYRNGLQTSQPTLMFFDPELVAVIKTEGYWGFHDHIMFSEVM